MEPIEIKRREGKTYLTLAPILDVTEARSLYTLLNRALKRKPPLVLDGSRLERVDTPIMQLLAAFCHAVRTRGMELQWAEPSAALLRTAEILDLQTMLEIEP